MKGEMSKGERTRQRIVVSAAPLFNCKGFAGCSMQDIMDATGLEKGTIYRYFSSKEQLAAEAFDYAWKSSSGARSCGLEQISNSVDRLKEHVALFITGTPFPGGCPMLNTALDTDDGNPVLRKRAQGALESWKAKLCSIVSTGQAKGEIRPEADPEAVAGLMISLLEGASAVAALEQSDRALKAAQVHLEGYFETAVRMVGE